MRQWIAQPNERSPCARLVSGFTIAAAPGGHAAAVSWQSKPSRIPAPSMLASWQLKSSKPTCSFFRDARNAAVSSRLIVTPGAIMLGPFKLLRRGRTSTYRPAALTGASPHGWSAQSPRRSFAFSETRPARPLSVCPAGWKTSPRPTPPPRRYKIQPRAYAGNGLAGSNRCIRNIDSLSTRSFSDRFSGSMYSRVKAW